jgi:hypothetical protein
MLSSVIVTTGGQGLWPVVQTLNFSQVGALIQPGMLVTC